MNKRKEFRLAGNHTVVIQANSEKSTQDILIACASVDISSEGLQVTVSHPLQPENIYFVTVIPEQESDNLTLQPITFSLVGEVAWCKPITGNTDYRVGLKILNSEDDHYLCWKQWVLQALRGLENK